MTQPDKPRFPKAGILVMMAVLLVLFVLLKTRRASHVADTYLVPAGDSRLANRTALPVVAHSSLQSSAAPQESRRVISTEITYGAGEGELGMDHSHGETPVGPEAFAIGPDGTVLIADRVNQRVSFWSAEGKFLRSLRVDEMNLNDLAADARGALYVYDQATHLLRQYSASGSLIGELQLRPKDIETRGYLHVTGDEVYFADAAARDVLVGTVINGTLAKPMVNRSFDGVHAQSGLVYVINIARNERLGVLVKGDSRQVDQTQIEYALPGILAARFVGEDAAGRFYVQTERLNDGKVELEVVVFGPDGVVQQTNRLPQNDYGIWTTKLVDVTGNGAIVQFVPGDEAARLNLLLE